MTDPFTRHFAMMRAIDAAWRRMKASTAPSITIGEFAQQVMAKCPYADENFVRQELKHRIENYRHRRKS